MKRIVVTSTKIALIAMLGIFGLLLSSGTSFAASTSATTSTTAATATIATMVHHPLVADSSCFSTGCFNQDPFQENCSVTSSSTKTITDQFGTALATITNAFSSGCDANWAEGSLSNGVGLRLTISTSGESTLCEPSDCTSTLGFANFAWTNMVNGTNVASACAFTTGPRDGLHYSLCVDM